MQCGRIPVLLGWCSGFGVEVGPPVCSVSLGGSGTAIPCPPMRPPGSTETADTQAPSPRGDNQLPLARANVTELPGDGPCLGIDIRPAFGCESRQDVPARLSERSGTHRRTYGVTSAPTKVS